MTTNSSTSSLSVEDLAALVAAPIEIEMELEPDPHSDLALQAFISDLEEMFEQDGYTKLGAVNAANAELINILGHL